MTERQEVRFNFYNKSADIIGRDVTFPFNEVDFNEGGGTYDLSTYEYTIPVDGTYLLGLSYVKALAESNEAAIVGIILIRNGATTILNRSQNTERNSNQQTIKSCLVFQFLKGDILFCRCIFAQEPRMNNTAYTTDDIYNSFWGIRLDY